MKKILILLLILSPTLVSAQYWHTRDEEYIFIAIGADLRNAIFGGTVNDASYDGTFSLGYRNYSFSIMAYYETFKAINYESAGINPGIVLRPGKELIPTADLSLSLIRRPWHTYPSLALNTRLEYHFNRFFIYGRTEFRWRTDYDFFQISGYIGMAMKFGTGL